MTVMAMFDLVFLSGVRAGAVIPIEHNVDLGRSQDCKVEVPDPNASRFHAVLEFDGQSLRLVDENSSNGTYVNEERTQRRELRHGDVLRIGETRIRIQKRRRPHTDESSSKHVSSVFNVKEPDPASLDSSLSLSLIDDDPHNLAGRSAEVLSARLEAIMWVSETLANYDTDVDIFATVLETLFQVFPQAERGHLLLGDTFEELDARASLYRTGKKPNDTIEVSATLCRAALEQRSVIAYSDKEDSDFDQSMSLVSLNIRSAMVVPLMIRDEVLGLLVIDTKDPRRPFNNDDMELAAAAGRQVAFRLKNALLLDQVEEEVGTRRNLMRFLPKPVVDQAMGGTLDLALGGSDYRGILFFADVIGFTRLAEGMESQAVISMMNAFFNDMVPCVEEEEGAIDKFMGDSIMAFWGVPFDHGDSSQHAIVAGIKMQTACAGFNSEAEEQWGHRLHMGVGVAAGKVVAGNVGSSDRLEYTVLGNTVNTASRVQSIACRHQVLVTDSVYRQSPEAIYGVALPTIQVKNKSEAVRVYSVRAIAVEGGELLMHLPVLIDGRPGILIRRLHDANFILLHADDCEGDQLQVQTDLVELPATDLGTARMVTRLFRQNVDGVLRRSVLELTDPSLAGLLGDEPLLGPLPWEDMQRGTN